MTTANLPAWGYGIRYNYGMFKQELVDGWQHERPDYWYVEGVYTRHTSDPTNANSHAASPIRTSRLSLGNPWEIERLDVFYPVRFYGETEWYQDEGGNWRVACGGDVFFPAGPTAVC